MAKLQNKRKPRSQDQNSQFAAPMFKSHVQRKFVRGKAIDELFECSFVWIPFTKFQIPPTLMKTNQTQR